MDCCTNVQTGSHDCSCVAAKMYRLVHITAVVLQLLWYYIIRPLAESPKTQPWFGANHAHFKHEEIYCWTVLIYSFLLHSIHTCTCDRCRCTGTVLVVPDDTTVSGMLSRTYGWKTIGGASSTTLQVACVNCTHVLVKTCVDFCSHVHMGGRQLAELLPPQYR